MARKGNPALIGAFVLGAVVLAVAALVVFGGGKLFRRTQTMVAYFDGSLKGMAIGAPVTFNGIKIGTVTDLKVVIDPERSTIRTPIFFQIDAGRLQDASGAPIALRKGAPWLGQLVERGLRAQPELQSLVTGQLQVGLNFHPETPVRLTGLSPEHPEMPTIPSSMDKLSQTLENLPLDVIIADVRRTLHSIDTLVNAPEIKETLRALTATVTNADRLVSRVTREVTPLMTKVDAIGDGAGATMADLRQVLARLGPVAESTLKDYQKLAVNAETQHGPLAASVETTLAQAQRTLASADAAIDTESPLRYDLARALKEIQLAARSLRGLTDYLEQHPEAVVSGKRTRGAQ